MRPHIRPLLRRIRREWQALTLNTGGPIILDAEYRKPLAQLLGLMAPQCAVGVAKRRYGSKNDGGYVMLDDFAGISSAFSLGIGGNVDWDLAMAEKGLRLFQYDYTVPCLPASHPNFEFHKIRIGSPEEDTTPTRSLATLIANRPPGDMILKIDIEGAEWEVLADLDPIDLKAFRQIVAEFHDFQRISDPKWRERTTKALEHLNQQHAVVHVHGNNCAPIVRAGDIAIPTSLELSYARKDAYQLAPTSETFPGPEDHPCNPYRSDNQLGTFRFD